MKTLQTLLTATLLMATLLLLSPTACRAQSESEQPEDMPTFENTASSCFFAQNCDLSSCTSDCVCYAKDCPGLSSCTENCQCDGGYCDLSSCVSGCQCYTGGCVMSAESEGDGPDSSCQRVAGGYGDRCTKTDGTAWVNPDQPPADTLPPGSFPADPKPVPAPAPSPPAEMDSTSASALVVANSSVLSTAFLAGTIACLLA